MINILADYIMSITIIDMSTLDYERCNEELSNFRWREIDYIRLGESKLFSIYDNHTLVGFTHVILMDNYDDSKDGELYKIFIFPKYQKKGYGKKAAKLAIDWIYQNCNDLYLEVVDDVVNFWCDIFNDYLEQYSLIFKERASSNTTKYIFSKN